MVRVTQQEGSEQLLPVHTQPHSGGKEAPPGTHQGLALYLSLSSLKFWVCLGLWSSRVLLGISQGTYTFTGVWKLAFLALALIS